MPWGNAGAANNYRSAGKWFKIQDGEDINITPVGEEVVMHYQTGFGVEPKRTSSEKEPGLKPRFYAQVFNHDASRVQIISLTETAMNLFNDAIAVAAKKRIDPGKARFIFSRRKKSNGFVEYSVVSAGKLSKSELAEVEQCHGELHDLYDEIDDVVPLEDVGDDDTPAQPAALDSGLPDDIPF